MRVDPCYVSVTKYPLSVRRTQHNYVCQNFTGVEFHTMFFICFKAAEPERVLSGGEKQMEYPKYLIKDGMLCFFSFIFSVANLVVVF